MPRPSLPRTTPRGRVSLLLLCIVILAMLVPGVLSYVRTRAEERNDAERFASRLAVARTRARALARERARERALRPPTARDTATTTPPAAPPFDSTPIPVPPSLAHLVPGTRRTAARMPRAATRRPAPRVTADRPVATLPTSAPTATPTAAPPASATAVPVTTPPSPHSENSAPGDFVVLSAGDEELAPVSLTPTPDGAMMSLYEVGTLLGAIVTEEQGTIRIELHADEPVVTTLSAWTLKGTRTMHGKDSVIVLPQGQLAKRDERWFVSPDALHALTGLDFAFDTRSQSLVITSPKSRIPRFAASVRRAQRSLLLAREAAELSLTARPAAGAPIVGSGWAPDMAALTYAVSQDNATGKWSGQGTLGAAVLGGGLSVSGAVGSGSGGRKTPDVTWLGGNPLSKWLTQARVGYLPRRASRRCPALV